jgi:hypothetical protein
MDYLKCVVFIPVTALTYNNEILIDFRITYGFTIHLNLIPDFTVEIY